MPSVLISISRNGIERGVPLHSFLSFVLLLAMLAKLYVYVFFWALGQNLYFHISFFV